MISTHVKFLMFTVCYSTLPVAAESRLDGAGCFCSSFGWAVFGVSTGAACLLACKKNVVDFVIYANLKNTTLMLT